MWIPKGSKWKVFQHGIWTTQVSSFAFRVVVVQDDVATDDKINSSPLPHKKVVKLPRTLTTAS
jgi:hypothetical protein